MMTADTVSPVVHGHARSDVLAPVANEPESAALCDGIKVTTRQLGMRVCSERRLA